MQQSSPRSSDTSHRILDAAEELFIEHGYAATSLRAIANRAEVNLAATNYHFGSKLGLLEAAFHRHIQPINEQRLSLLKGLIESDRSLTTKMIVEALLEPLLRSVHNTRVPALMGRFLSEPESITKPILQKEFVEVATTFQYALATVLPNVSPQALSWRFHFMIGSMIHLMKFQAPLSGEYSPELFREGVDELIHYSVAGLELQNELHQHD